MLLVIVVFIMRSGVFFEVIFAAETFGTQVTGEWSLTGVNASMPSELFVACECLLTEWLVAFVRPLASMDPNVTSELSSV